ncbi:hypothetical protein B0H17DRAFT_1136969 [Mycena rosella]|uniref:Uncharacterized protein n=1 Tax=Mycena rosella TaxID=1033263 RepID=A0AAD7DAX9_MYCRO|nr:hypothetical protein B0H17DRAFT_1136969 [Mycena rosella]
MGPSRVESVAQATPQTDTPVVTTRLSRAAPAMPLFTNKPLAPLQQPPEASWFDHWGMQVVPETYTNSVPPAHGYAYDDLARTLGPWDIPVDPQIFDTSTAYTNYSDKQPEYFPAGDSLDEYLATYGLPEYPFDPSTLVSIKSIQLLQLIDY